MSLQDPLFLALLALIPLGLLAHRLAERRRLRYAVRFPALATLAGVAAAPSPWRRRLPAALLALAVAALAFALTRPQRSVDVPTEQASVMLVQDASGSMDATDVAPSRLAVAIDAAHAFLDRVPPATRVGLVVYGTAPYTAQPPSTDRDLVRATLDSVVADGGTATGDALATALQALGHDVDAPEPRAADAPPAAIVLLSDGKSMGGRDPDPVAEAAGELGVPIYTVALGTPEGVVYDPLGRAISVPPDPAQLRRIANASGGEAFAVDDAERLEAVYERLGSRLGTEPRRREMTSAFAGLGLLALLAAGALSVRWRGRIN